MPKSKAKAPRKTKTALLRKLLRRKSGSDLAALQAATGWQPHSVRAALSQLRTAGYSIERTGPTKSGTAAVYRIISSQEGRQ